MKKVHRKWRIIGIGALLLAAVWLLLRDNLDSNRMVVTSMKGTYQNPMTLEAEWEDYGIGDPYVLRYNGKYYLYCSTKDWRLGVKAWSSDDLVHWAYEGLVTEEPLTEGAYAPEVVYWNGSFYMYTSPAGKGHYVLKSEQPTGPFKVETENLGLTIDGSVFIDDDGKWYFTHAESGGIMAGKMKDPYTIDFSQKLNTSLGHWTEGSMIIKRSGRYFLTYTGNHVFSTGYRVNYAVGHDSPLGLYTIPENNPILISTEDDFNGLGHSATVLGPDLDSYYIVYHNLVGHSAEGPPVRKLNMDRLAFNGDKMVVLGPTHGTPAEAPALPEFHDALGSLPEENQWENRKMSDGDTVWLGKKGTGDRFTAEYNVVIQPEETASSPGYFGMILSYNDPSNYRVIRIDTETKKLILAEKATAGEEKTVFSIPLPEGMDLGQLHTVRSEADASGTRVYWDGLLLADYREWAARAGKIGYTWTQGLLPKLYYTAFSNEAGGSSDNKAVKQVPGTLEAVHGVAEGTAEVGITAEGTPDGSFAAILQKGAELTFPVHVKRSGTYLVTAMVSNKSAGAKLEIAMGKEKKTITLDTASFAADSDWMKVPLAGLSLKAGLQQLTLNVIKGEAEVRFLEIAETAPVKQELPLTLDIAASFGDWREDSGNYSVLTDGRDAKIFGGDPEWSDYQISFQLSQKEEMLGEASVLLRTTNESDFPDQVTDSFMGYELAFRNGRIILRKINYEINQELDTALLVLPEGKPTPLTVSLDGASIRVFAGSDSSGEPILAYTDSNAFMHGRMGFRTSSPGWVFSNPVVKPIKE